MDKIIREKDKEKFKKMHIDAINKLKKDFANSTKYMEQKNQNLMEEIKELENFIIGMKEEDGKTIGALRKGLDIKDKEINELKQIIENNNKKILMLSNSMRSKGRTKCQKKKSKR